MFWIFNAPETSAGVTLYERILSGSTQTLICRSWPPMIVTWPTPLTDSIVPLILVFGDLGHLAKRDGAEIEIRRTGAASVSSFCTVGCLAVSGRFGMTV